MRKFAVLTLAALVFATVTASAQNKGGSEDTIMIMRGMRQTCIAAGASAASCTCMAGYFAGVLTDQEMFVLGPALSAMQEGRSINEAETAGVRARADQLGLSDGERQTLGQSLIEKGARISAESGRVEEICRAL